MLKIENLKVAYGKKVVLDSLSIDFQYNEIHGVVGMNGTGKTTLFNTLYGQKAALAGQVSLDDQAVLSKQIAYLETKNFFYPYMNGREYLQLLSLGRNDFDIDQWNQLFELPLQGLVDKYSTGMKKKLAFLGVMALQRPVLILDEPFNGVDVESNEKIYQILERIRSPQRIIIISSHIIQGLTGLCDRISYLSGGKFTGHYQKDTFDTLEQKLRDMVKEQIDDTLNQLLPE